MLFHRFANDKIGQFLRVFFRINERKLKNPRVRLPSNATRHPGPPPRPPRSPRPLTLVFVGEAPLSDGVAGGEPLLGDGAVSGDGHGQDPGVGGHTARRRLAAVPTDVGAHWGGRQQQGTHSCGGNQRKADVVFDEVSVRLAQQ